jgi:adenine-specific DNA-methyltransferase
MPEDYTAKQTDWRDELLATGILGRGGAKIEFSRVEPLSGTTYLQAEAETKEDIPRRAVICFADETKPMDSRMVALALTEAEDLRPSPKLIVFAAFQFDPEAGKGIDKHQVGWRYLPESADEHRPHDGRPQKRNAPATRASGSSGSRTWNLFRLTKARTKANTKSASNGFDYYDVKKGPWKAGTPAHRHVDAGYQLRRHEYRADAGVLPTRRQKRRLGAACQDSESRN